MSFLESVFSFVFGDGDPNVDFEEKRWQMVRFDARPKVTFVALGTCKPSAVQPLCGQSKKVVKLIISVSVAVCVQLCVTL